MTETPRDDKPKPARRPRIKLPFDNRREDVGSWTYDHRIGLCVTLIAYLALMIVFVSSKIVVGRRTHQQGMYIDGRRRSTGGASATRRRTKTP